MTHLFKNVDLASYSLDIGYITDLTFLQHLHCYFLSAHRMNAKLDFSEGPLS